uniref:UBA domain-containing protein n=1 Tax=Globisporangium ultimum (strain ATCC 200006 / CBS 805.95 / DAOM BR144) TaxID=431595 RepID=K3W5T0_GLOUD
MHGDLRGFSSSASLIFDQGRLLTLEREAVLSRMQYWRLLTNQVTFHHGLAVSFGLYVMFQFRVIERQMGSRKFGSLVVFILSLTSGLELAALMSAPSLARQIPGGPYALLGALAVFFNKYIPKLYPRSFSFSGLNFSDKSSTYLLLIVMLGRNPNTLLSFAPGALFGLLFSSTPLARLRLPSFLLTTLGIFHPLFDVVPASVVALQRQRRVLEAQRRLGVRNNQQNMPAGQGFRDQLLPGAGGGMLPPHMAAAPPSEDAIQQLMALGFDRERAITALQSTSNNVEAAANRLLNGL